MTAGGAVGNSGDGSVNVASFAELDTGTLYALLQLRVDVFVVEQKAAYPELDGRDLEAGTRHFWTDDGSGPDAYLRLLDDGQNYRIGRVCTRSDARRSGRAGDLMNAALEVVGDRAIALDAQTYVAGWYERFGFRTDGDEYVDEDGIPHVPMRRPGRNG